MVQDLRISRATSSDMNTAIADVTVDSMSTDGVADQKETTWTNENWAKYWGYFNAIPELKSAIILKAIWVVGKGFTTDNRTQAQLDNIRGWGKDTFQDILFNMEVTKSIGGDAFAEIVRNDDGTLINLKPLDPGSIQIVVNKAGIVLRYEQISKNTGSINKKFQPENMLHLSHNRIADQIHGISDIAALEETILAENENFTDMKKLMHHQVKPFILWKLKTDDQTVINNLVAKIDKARNLGEDMFIPDDNDAVEYEIVQINVQSAIFEWRNDIRNKFYRTVGMPQIVPGASGGSTESESKVIYLAFEQIVEKHQIYWEGQLWLQLAIRLDLIHPATLQENLQQDNAKDGAAFQSSDTTAGVGR